VSETERKPAPLAFKPDLEDAARRWNAFFAGDIIDRPVVCVTAPRPGFPPPTWPTYRERAFGDIDEVIDRALAAAEATYWGGEAVPNFLVSFGPDEIAVFCGATLRWNDASGDTSWSVPCIEDWEQALPIRLQYDHPLWQRMLEIYRRAAERMGGKVLLTPPDLHTNMDLLAAMRGPQRLCLDLLERPDIIDRAMADTLVVFRELWDAVTRNGRMDEWGYWQGVYSMEGAAMLQCDFSAMISPKMFRRWVLPVLEEEAAIVKHVYYHWDGPGALPHANDLIASKGLHTLSYVPGEGRGQPINYLDLYCRVQAGGKAVAVWGTPEELKQMHRELRPEKTLYSATVNTPDEAEELLEWFVKNT
jgi:hypothetical protein